MKITIIAVGKLKERFWLDAQAEYVKRLGGYAKVRIVEVADRDPSVCGGELAAMQREAAEVLMSVGASTYTVLLAIEGKQRSSEDFSARIDELKLRGKGDITFIVGGSTGVDASVAARADEALSFGPITLPHNLARIVLLEQVYRAFRISRGEPYHK